MVVKNSSFFIFNKKRKVQVFENKALRKMFEPTMPEVTGEFSMLHNKELHGLGSSHSIVRTTKFMMLRW
jgi:hypothetical protein